MPLKWIRIVGRHEKTQDRRRNSLRRIRLCKKMDKEPVRFIAKDREEHF